MKKSLSAIAALATSVSLAAFTTDNVPSDGVYKFTFGVSETGDGSLPVPASAVYDVNGTYDSDTFSYGFLGTTATSYTDDIHSDVPTIPYAMDGFEVVSGQQIVLHDTNTPSNVSCVCGPAASEYLPAGASSYEGRYPIRFAMRGEERAYYAVTCTVVNVSSTANADVTLFSERCHIQAHHLALGPGETRTFAWSVELAPNYFKGPGKYYDDDTINVVLVGENAALASLTVVKQPQKEGTVRGDWVDNMNVGKTMWLCDDSTGTDQRNATPYFSLQNYSGVGSGLSKYAPASLSIRNQGEGGLATGADTHRTSCLLKPGDYLYVEYGHNESSVTSYTNNLETYLADANTAGAYLVIVSPVERRSSWNSTTSTWNRSLQAISEAGEAWVEDKIAQGATNVAFIDLNKRYNTWMNEEIVRIHNINSEVSLTAAISYYYRSAKGANVDNTHINNAGTDQAAYWVWYDALARVEAGEAEGATTSQKVQAAVLKGITEGYQSTVGIDGTESNLPWSVTDEIINAESAPNSYWDTPVTTGYDYVNDAVVADVDATANSDGTVTISGVTMRILNPNNYYKAVIDVVSADEATTNRYYSYYNYDVGGAGKVSGDLVTPEQSGFLMSDAAKDDVSAADCATITVPENGKAYVWFAEADDSTLAVGTNAACSAKYPVEWWSDVLLADDCSSCDGWGVNSAAVWTTNVVDGAIYFTTSGADSSNTKKAFGLYRSLGVAMTNGRYRVTFKAMLDSGTINFVVGDAVYKTTTMPFYNSKTMLSFAGTDVTGYNSLLPAITVDGDDAEQSVINALRWVDVDFIVDRDNERAWLSVGGSEYVEYSDASFLPGSYAGTTWNHFGVYVPAQKSAYGYVDDVKVVKLASVEYPTVTATVSVNSSTMGSVSINGYVTNSLAVYAGNDLLLKATSANNDLYKFSKWQDVDGNTVSTSAALYIANAAENVSYTAVFAEYGAGENRVLAWDFSDYQGDFELAPTEATVVTNNNMVFSLQSGDTMTGSGLLWANSALGHGTKKETLSESGDHYIVYKPSASGTLTLKFSVDSYTSSRKPTMIIKAADSTSVCTNDVGDVVVKAEAADTEYTLSASLTADTTYYIWTYSYNWSTAKFYHNYTISSIEYSYTVSEDLIDITRNADFSTFAGDDAITNTTAAWTQLIGRMEVHGAAGDALTDAGVYWAGPGTTTSDYTVNNSGRYIKFECVKSGTLTLVFKSDGKYVKNYGRIYVVNGTSDGTNSMSKNNSDSNGKNVTATAKNSDTTGSFSVTAGETYYIWPYMYHQSTAQFWVTSITYAAVKSDYSALTIANAAGDGASVVTNVYYGGSVLVDAAASTSTQVFDKWVDADSSTLSADTHVRVTVTNATTVTAVFRDVDAHSFVWKSSVASGEWNDAANWLYDGVVQALTYPSDVSCDVATFNSEATVSFASAGVASNVWFNANVTLASSSGNGLTVVMSAGEGALTLQDTGFSSVSGTDLVISNDLCIAGTTTNWVNQYNANAHLYGNLTGSGIIRLWNDATNDYKGARLYGNNMEFAGEVVYSGGTSSSRRYQKWASGDATSSNAFWTVEAGAPTSVKNDDGDMVGSIGTYYFGGYSGAWWKLNYADSYTLEIGALNKDSDISCYTYAKAPNITKVGTANLTLGTTKIKNLTVNGGSVTMPVGIAPKTLTVASGTTLSFEGDPAWACAGGTVTNLCTYTTLAGTGAETLASQVSVTGLSGCKVTISVADNAITATIKPKGIMIIVK